ncbi:carbohydrate ABC transporter permease [Phreatobacter stygius]|uniref:Sugar ABC transporter permease n=1 Tax=Phreatobacter stygius TaxID=1940610 RepID=A0A4D7BNW9_9HYPH|nr:sugar ABC transporter permease [Phreatobacter stygius]QCI69302.1 sugar ABC transporter permease [Phreatobacter stygius]
MVDTALSSNATTSTRVRAKARPSGLRKFLQRKSTIAFFMALPLILLILTLVVYPAFYAIYLSTLRKSMTSVAWMRNCQWLPDAICGYIPFGNIQFLFTRETFWMVVWQSCLFAISAVIFKALIGFIVAHFVHNIPAKGQRKWRGMLLIPWVIPPAMSTLAWLWLFDPSYSAFNYALSAFNAGPIPWTGNANWARFSVILVNIWVGAPFFMIMYLAALKSVPDQLYEAAAIDGANWWQRIWYVTLPMMRNIIAITALFSTIVTFANFDIVRVLTAGGPLDKTHLFATWAFRIGIEGGDIPLGASVSLFMVPILAIAAIFILRDITKRGNEA